MENQDYQRISEDGEAPTNLSRYEGFGALYKGLVLDSMKIGYEVPWLIVVAEDDLDSFLMEIQNSIRLSKQIVKDMRIDTHIPISYPTNCVRNEFYDILV
ncbi:hypothetical protein GQ457_04G005580 [Hibiscus cannabinus]